MKPIFTEIVLYFNIFKYVFCDFLLILIKIAPKFVLRGSIVHNERKAIILTHWERDKMDAILQTTIPNAFSWMEIYEFWIRVHLTMLPKPNWQ